jgi:hypothetical protein
VTGARQAAPMVAEEDEGDPTAKPPMHAVLVKRAKGEA